MVTSVNLSISLPPLANFSYNSFKIKRKAKKSPVNPMGHIGTFKTLEHTIMGNKELNAREWAKQNGVSYKQTLRWLADPKIRKSKFPSARLACGYLKN
jgi:hypothetical protein